MRVPMAKQDGTPSADSGQTGDDGITLQMVMNHMHEGFSSLRSELKREMNVLRKEMDDGFSRVWRRFDWVDTSLGNLNTRLDDIEIESLPKRVAALERKGGR